MAAMAAMVNEAIIAKNSFYSYLIFTVIAHPNRDISFEQNIKDDYCIDVKN